MDFQSAIEFVGAILVVVIAGVLLGMSLARRGQQKPRLDHDRLEAYVDLVHTMDGLRQADKDHKKMFIDAYYRALMFAPDKVVRALNAFLQAVTASEESYDPAAQASARDKVVLAMRQDTHDELKSKTKAQASELYSIEVNEPGGRPSEADPDPDADLLPGTPSASAALTKDRS